MEPLKGFKLTPEQAEMLKEMKDRSGKIPLSPEQKDLLRLLLAKAVEQMENPNTQYNAGKMRGIAEVEDNNSLGLNRNTDAIIELIAGLCIHAQLKGTAEKVQPMVMAVLTKISATLIHLCFSPEYEKEIDLISVFAVRVEQYLAKLRSGEETASLEPFWEK